MYINVFPSVGSEVFLKANVSVESMYLFEVYFQPLVICKFVWKTPCYVHIYVLHLIILPGIKEKSIVNKIYRERKISRAVFFFLGEIFNTAYYSYF